MSSRLVNLAIEPSGVRYKQSSMPFVQMENISHFLRACQAPPLGLPPHDVFLTVDLYEAKDPAQVVQCIGAFSRRANILHPERFPRAVGARGKGIVSPQNTGSSNSGYSSGLGSTYGKARVPSNTSESSVSTSSTINRSIGAFNSNKSTPLNMNINGGAISPQGGISSWSKKTDEGKTTPAWNIHQYGYMGGASQGNQGITFGGRRQITTPSPKVPSLAEKERKRREAATETERLRVQAEEVEHRRRVEREAEEERDRIAEERQWEEETRKQRELEKQNAENEKRKWEEEERKWKEEEKLRLKDEKEAEARFERERQRKRANSEERIRHQFLSHHQAEQPQLPRNPSGEDPERITERERVKDLERQLEEAKERERQYERERQERLRFNSSPQSSNGNFPRPAENSPETSASAPSLPSRPHKNSVDSWQADEREYLRQEWSHQQDGSMDESSPPQPPRPLPIPQSLPSSSPVPPNPSETSHPSLPTRPLPDPKTYTQTQFQSRSQTPVTSSRTARFLSSNPAPTPSLPISHVPLEAASTSTAEHDAENARRLASQNHTKAGAWAGKSLLEREMERERQRQQEWEEAQKATKEAAAQGLREDGAGTGPGESWNVNQYGYLGGDSQNRGGVVFGARRQLVGPRPRP